MLPRVALADNQLLFQVKHHSSTFAEIGMGERAFFSVDLINSWAPIPASGWMASKAAPCNQVPLADFLPWTMLVQWPMIIAGHFL